MRYSACSDLPRRKYAQKVRRVGNLLRRQLQLQQHDHDMRQRLSIWGVRKRSVCRHHVQSAARSVLRECHDPAKLFVDRNLQRRRLLVRQLRYDLRSRMFRRCVQRRSLRRRDVQSATSRGMSQSYNPTQLRSDRQLLEWRLQLCGDRYAVCERLRQWCLQN
jgi:hypothetical protein